MKSDHPNEDFFRYLRLIVAEYRLGRQDASFKHFAHLLANTDERDVEYALKRLLGDVFWPKGGAAEVWWAVLRRRSPREEVQATLHKVDGLLGGKITGEDLAALLEEAEQALARVKDEDGWKRMRWLEGLAETCLAAGRPELARPFLWRAGRPCPTGEPLIRLGDLLAEEKRWREAAEAYGRAWEKDRQQAPPLYLRGWTLARAGREREGHQLTERAHWMPLGSAEDRYRLAQELSRRGLAGAARRERELAVRLGWCEDRVPVVIGGPEPWSVDSAVNPPTGDAPSPQELGQAVVRCERVMLEYVGGSNALDRQASFYLGIPHRAHFYRARVLLADGRVEEALQEARLCLAFLPGDLEMPTWLVPELEKRGRQKEADELFGRVFTLYDRLCKDYPRWAEGHNSLAWLAARCRRRLDAGLEHSRQAVRLAPGNTVYLGTLAEVHFQRGETKQALELIK
jgi:tetratricopeptide (TPR) repeat protein